MPTKTAYPELRFKEFSEAWISKSINDIAIKVGSGSTPLGGESAYVECGIPFIRSQNVVNNQLNLEDVRYIPSSLHSKMSGTHVKPSDILLNITGGSIGRSCVVPVEFDSGNVNQHVCIIRLKETESPYFFQTYLASDRGQKMIMSTQAGGGREGLNFQAIRSFEIFCPSISEQSKIASFITNIDNKINLLSRKNRLLTDYKKGVMQKIFRQEIKFRDEHGQNYPEWKLVQLKDIADRVNRKNSENNQNVLTISAQKGLVNQQDYFTKSVAAKDVTGYYLLKNGEFAYNKSYSKGYPMGAIKRLKMYDKGVVSTLYICFKLKSDCDISFFEHYFDGGIQNEELGSVAQEGARNHGLLNIGLEQFFGIDIYLPSLDEQKRIGSFLDLINLKINESFLELELTMKYKQGLLQRMFI